EFRQDLFYRLNVLKIGIPALRERRDDVPVLIQYFLQTQCDESQQKLPTLTREVLKALMDYSWPGNIRELQNEVRRWLALKVGKIVLQNLSPHIREEVDRTRPLDFRGGMDKILNETEKRTILEAMLRFHGNKVKVAKALKLSRTT